MGSVIVTTADVNLAFSQEDTIQGPDGIWYNPFQLDTHIVTATIQGQEFQRLLIPGSASRGVEADGEYVEQLKATMISQFIDQVPVVIESVEPTGV